MFPQTIDWIMETENALFPDIAGQLGTSRESTVHYQNELAKYEPIRKVDFDRNLFFYIYNRP